MEKPAPPAPDIEVLSTHAGYDLWSAIYDGEGNPLLHLEGPLVERLLGDVRGLAVADIGCGTGRHSLRMAAAGAKVTALDFSEGMLAAARKKPGAELVDFIQHDLSQRLPLDDAAYDRVLCALVLDHVKELAALFGEMRRICKPRGHIVVSIMHPAMMLKGVQARFTNPATGREARPASVPNVIADYVTAVLAAGLRIEHISEHAVDERLATECPRAAKYLNWPLLLLMRLMP